MTVEEIVRLAIREQAAQKAAELHGLVELVVWSEQRDRERWLAESAVPLPMAGG